MRRRCSSRASRRRSIFPSAAFSSRPTSCRPTSPEPTCSATSRKAVGYARKSVSCRDPSSKTSSSPTRSTARRRKRRRRLLQAMQERCVTAGGVTHPLPEPFQVFATRNPIEQEGTYPLPEAQLDRFLLEIHVELPFGGRRARDRATHDLGPATQHRPRRDRGRASPARRARSAHSRDGRCARPCGASRPAIASRERRTPRKKSPITSDSARARVAVRRSCWRPRRAPRPRGEAATDVEDVEALALPALRHRLVLSYRADVDNVTAADIVKAILRKARG